jgi:hypothetical protein
MQILTTFRSLTCFFSKYIGSDYPLDLDVWTYLDNKIFYFFTNGLFYKDLLEVEVLLRFSLKMEFAYVQNITPIDLLNYLSISDRLEEARKKSMEDMKRK